MKNVGKTIKRGLDEKGLSQKQLAEMMHVTPQAVSKWILGDSLPQYDKVVEIQKILGVDLAKDISKRMFHKRENAMRTIELSELDNYEKAVAEATLILSESHIDVNYSHPVYMLCKWLLTSIIGLTYHQLIHRKTIDDEPITYQSIWANLNDYLDENTDTDNYLDERFDNMGMDLFESFGEYKLINHDYCRDSLNTWAVFCDAVGKNAFSPTCCDLRIAIHELLMS